MTSLQTLLQDINGQDPTWRQTARVRLEQLAIPRWSLGRLQDLALELAGMTRSLTPALQRRAVITCAGDHGVVCEGVSAFPQAVTVEMVANFLRGGASINALAAAAGAQVFVADFGVAADLRHHGDKILHKKVRPGTANLAAGPAMSRDDAERAILGGMEIVQELDAQTDIFATGDMGIGNTTPSAAICSVLAEVSVAEVTGRGTGISAEALQHKIAVIERGIALNRPDPDDGLDVLAKVGGFEIGGIAGVILGAARAHKPVIVDGFISTAGALIAQALCPAAAEYMILAHRSQEPGHQKMMQMLGKQPLLDLGLRLGEGTGAALAFPLVAAAATLLSKVMTFEEAAVSEGQSRF